MDDSAINEPSDGPLAAAQAYRAPTVTRLGDLADLTGAKTVGGADGHTFLGLDIGSV